MCRPPESWQKLECERHGGACKVVGTFHVPSTWNLGKRLTAIGRSAVSATLRKIGNNWPSRLGWRDGCRRCGNSRRHFRCFASGSYHVAIKWLSGQLVL